MGDWDVVGTAPVGEWDVVSHAPSDAEPADHGLSERQKLSQVGTALSPITSYWPTYQKMRGEAYNQAAEGLHQMANPDSLTDPEAHGLWDVGAGALKTAVGGFNYLLGSPVNAAYRSLVGQPIEDVTGIPREQTELAAQLLTPGIGFTKLPMAPGAIAETLPKIKTMQGPDLTSPEAEASRKLAKEFDIQLTRGQATGDVDAIRREDMASRGAYGPEQQQIAKPAFEDQFQDIQSAGQQVGQQLSRGEGPLGTPADAGAALNAEVADRAAAARGERDTAAGTAERDAQRQRELADERGRTISENIAGGRPQIENTRDAGELVGQGIRDAANENRNEFRGLYNRFGQMEGYFPLDAVRGMGARVRDDLSNADRPVIIDDHLTPAASRAIQMLDEMSGRPSIQNRAAPRMPMSEDTTIAGVNLQGIDRMRRHLVAYYKTTKRGSEDQRAVQAIMHSFDGSIENAITQGLFSGDPHALEVLQNARASYSRYRQTFGPTRAGDDVGLAMQRIVDRHATPEEIANMVVGSGKLGNAGLPVRIADRLEQVLGAQSPEFNSVRQAIWQKASQVRNTAGEVDPLRSARSISDFTGSSLARRMFTPQELTAMRNHAEGVRGLEATIENLPSTQAAARAQQGYEALFGGEGLTGTQRGVFQRMVEGTATPEETANTMFSIIGGGNPGNAVRALTAIERVVGRDSPVMGAVRQGVWQKLTQNAFGKDQPGQQKTVQAINEFLNGKGRMIARQLYTGEERALMNRYSDAVRKTIIPKYARTNSDTAVAAAAQQHKMVASLASAVSSMLHLGPLGHLGGHAVTRMLNNRFKTFRGAADLKSLGESIHDVIPPPEKLPPPPGPPRAFRPVPLGNALTQPPSPYQQQP